MAVKSKAQISMDDRRVDDSELEQLLEDRQAAKEKVSAYHDADKKAKAKITTLKETMPYRCGRFIISERTMPPRSVEFETKGSNSVSIKLAEE